MSEMRWNPLLGEWVVTATHRQDRTYKPPKEHCPFCPTEPGAFPTEVPSPDYEIVVFENRFPSFRSPAPVPDVDGTDLYPVAPAQGVCEVVLYSPDHHKTLVDMPESHIERLVRVWTDRYEELGSRDGIEYVFIFENRGDAVGVTLHHPHGQIYAFPFVPPIPRRELEQAARHREATGRCLLCDIVAAETSQGVGATLGAAEATSGDWPIGIGARTASGAGPRPVPTGAAPGLGRNRVVVENDDFAAYVPFFARYPYEVHIAAKRHKGSLLDFSDAERLSLARILKAQVSAYDNLFGFALPYMMVMHQAPTGRAYREVEAYREGAHFHIEFYPLNRTADKLKYLAGCESGAGTFITDMSPEYQAERLREALAKSRG